MAKPRADNWYKEYEERRRAKEKLSELSRELKKTKVPEPSKPYKWGGIGASDTSDEDGIVLPGPRGHDCCGYVEMMGCGQICQGCPKKAPDFTLKGTWTSTYWDELPVTTSTPFTLKSMMDTLDKIKHPEKYSEKDDDFPF